MGIKIIVIGRTLNEAANIERFCTNYGFADKIIITDGGSADGTVMLATQFNNVQVIDVSYLRTEIEGEIITPESIQTNMTIDLAKEAGADWIIRDEADCWPNSSLREKARHILETTDKPSVFVYRLYLWGIDQYFPKYNEPGQSLWAWRPDEVDVYCEENLLWGRLRGLPAEGKRHNLEPPYTCLHYFAPDEATVQRKLRRYEAKGRPQVHPLRSIYAPPEQLPGWAL